jgi:hypothetical protein
VAGLAADLQRVSGRPEPVVTLIRDG